MNDLQQLMTFFGWASVINIAFLAFAAVLLVIMKGSISALHGKMFGVPENEVRLMYFKYLAYYKILIFVFVLSPYMIWRLGSCFRSQH